jgi:hypothetical protein
MAGVGGPNAGIAVRGDGEVAVQPDVGVEAARGVALAG